MVEVRNLRTNALDRGWIKSSGGRERTLGPREQFAGQTGRAQSVQHQHRTINA
ncbi:AAEL007553-PA [Aedes aegypti]|uniref:AAEL007553-PA n=1 Tax=Aedes aegypti TaxID=7159 RepID=Q171R7_AEDAE|nr:AAEL007553-PA [Aedes aegypti]